ncbi:MAG: hypothetical protein E6Q48_05350, partial [Limnohabitans sp.]
GANITTSGTQTYAGAVTLSGGDRTLSGSTVHTQGALAGGGNALTITGDADIDGAYSGLTSLSISGAANLGANITTSGTQTYAGAVTLSGGDRTLSGSTVHTQGALAGGGNALTITGDADIDGAYSGLTSLSISGAANLGANITTSGTQTYSGAATLSANAELAGSGITLAGVSLQSGSNAYELTINNSDAGSRIDGILSGTGSLVKKGEGTLTLNGNNTYSGTTSVSAGTLKLGQASALGVAASGSGTTVGANGSLDLNSLSVTEPVTLAGGRVLNGVLAGDMLLTADSTMEAAAGSSLTLSGVISGSYGLTVRGGGTITLSGNNSYTGNTTVSAGTLKVGHANALGTAAGGTTVAASATLDLLNVAVVAEALTLNGGTLKDATSSWGGNIQLGANSTFDVGAGDTLTVTGVISGSGRLVKTNAGTLVLGNALNTYEGGTTLTGGVLQVSADRNLGAVPVSVNANHIVLDGGTLQATSGFTLSENRGITVSANSTFSTDASVSVNYAGVMAGAAGLTKSGSGTLVLTGTNTHTGNMTIAAGTLQIGNGSTGELASASNITIDADATLAIHRSSDYTVANIISGAGALQQTGAGITTLAGDNSNFTGGTTIAAGVLNVGHVHALGSNSTGAIHFTGGTLQYSAANQVDYSARVAGAANQAIKIDTNGQEVTFATALTGAGTTLTKLGEGTLTLTAANAYTGDTNISAGTLKVTGALADSTDVVVALGATYTVEAADTIQSLSGAGTIELASGITLTTGDSSNQTVSGVIQGAGTLSKVGSGTLTLSGTNTYTGSTHVDAGMLKVTGTLADATDVVVASGGTYRAEASDTIASLSGAGSVALASGVTLTAGDSHDQTISGAISGAGSLTKRGTGTLTLTGNNTLTGVVSIDGGTLVASQAAGEALATAAKVIVGSGAVLDAGAPTGGYTFIKSLAGSGQVMIAADKHLKVTAGYSSDEFSGVISGGSGTGGLEIGGGTLTLSGVNTYSGNTDITGGATLKIKGSGSIAAAGTLYVSGANGAVLDISGASSGVTVNNLYSAGNLAGSVVLGDNTLTLNTTDARNMGLVVSGTGGVTKTGAGTLTLSAANAYTGETTISAGTLVLTGALDSATHVVLSGTSVWDLRTSQTVASLSMAIGSSITRGAGTSALTVTGTSSLANSVTTSGAQTYGGAVTLASGTTLSGSTIHTQGSLVGGGNALTITGAADIDGNYSGLTSLSISGASNLGANITTSGTQTYAGAVTLSGGDRMLTGSKIYTQSTLAGAGNALTITGDADIGGAYTGLTNLSISGATNLGANITTSGTQAYTDKVTVSSAVTLSTTNSDVTFGAGITLGESLTVNTGSGAGDIAVEGAVDGSKALTLNAGAGAITLAGAVGQASRLGAITLHSTGATTLSQAVRAASITTNAGGTLLIDGGSIHTTGPQTYGEVAVLGAATELTGTDISVQAMDLGAHALTVNTTGSSAVNGALTGSGSLTKSGSGTLSLLGVNEYSGGTVINAGTVFGGAGSLSRTAFGSGDITVHANASLWTDHSTLSNNLVLNGGVLEGSNGFGEVWNGTVSLTANSTVKSHYYMTLNGVISESGGAFGLTKAETGVLTLSGANTYTGDTTVSAGTVKLGAGASTGSIHSDSAVSVASGATFEVDRSDAVFLSNAISGAGGLSKRGNNTLTLTGANTYTGITHVDAGSVVFRRDVAPATSGFTGAGSVVIEPWGSSFSSALTTTYTYASTLSGLTIGKSGNTANVNFNSAASIAGDVSIHGGGIAVNATLESTASGSDIRLVGANVTMGAAVTAANDLFITASTAVTQSASITADGLVLQGGGNFALTNAGNNIAMLAAGSTDNRVGHVSVSSNSAFKVGARTLTGISSSGDVVLNSSGGVTVSEAVAASTLQITGPATLAANITTSGTQTYAGAVTLSGGDRTLSGSTVHTQGALAGGGNALTITGDADIDGAYSGLTSLSISGAANLGANITTSGTQTYAGAVTLSGGDRTLSGSTVHTQGALAGGGNALTITGDADIDGAYSGLTSLSISGASNLGANITTSGTQTYAGAVTLSGGDRTLSGSTVHTQGALA